MSALDGGVFNLIVTKTKDKAIPLQAWTGPAGSRSLRLPDFMTIGTRRW
jgi:hypothetical protein